MDDKTSPRVTSPDGKPLGGGNLSSEEDPLSSEPIVSPAPLVAAPTAIESCASCGAALAPDQRYCLECGSRRPAQGSRHAGDLQSLISLSSGEPAAPTRVQLGTAPAAPEPARTGSASAVIAGVGVLLLAMGVGVLIGRAGNGAKTATAPPAQVISVATPATGTATGTAGQAPATGATKSDSKHASAKHGASKSSASENSTAAPAGGIGQTPDKPAPPSAAEGLKGVKGGSYEQKSKNLPNVISTG